tara:strand:+ start:451 stop:828 length:378 start_codon:yes stop_codon:yes gene_type:complete
MGHYAFLNSQKKVTEVIKGRDEYEIVDGITDWEEYYGDFRGQTCKRTSYNTRAGVHLEGGTPFRKNFAGIGYKYYSSIDGFVPPKPYPSWTLNNTTGLWGSPTSTPTDDGQNYQWNEDNQTWDAI